MQYDYSYLGKRCPRCNSNSPERHPATAFEGEVELCTDDYHLIRSPSNRQQYIDAVLAKRANKDNADG